MRLSKHRRKTVAAMDMTPMIDITFQLMIFFMACSQISQVNREAKVELPKLKGSVDQQEKTTITVNVDAEGEIKVSGNSFTLAEFVSAIGDELVAAENEPTRIRVVLRADRKGTSRTVNQVVTALAKMNITQIRIAVQE